MRKREGLSNTHCKSSEVESKRSTSASSDCEIFHPEAPALLTTCSGDIAPEITEDTLVFASNQPNASSSKLCPRFSEKATNDSIRSNGAPLSLFAKRALVRREPSGGDWFWRYFPVRSPEASVQAHGAEGYTRFAPRRILHDHLQPNSHF